MFWGEAPSGMITDLLQEENIERARAKARTVFGDMAEQWYDVLPYWLDTIVRRWMLSSLRLFNADTVNVVLAAQSVHYGSVVVKMGPPHKELYYGAMALQVFNARLVPCVYSWSEEQYTLLMENVGEKSLLSVAKPELRWRIVVPFIQDIPCYPHDGIDYPRFEEQLEHALSAVVQRALLPEFAAVIQRTPEVWKAFRKLFARDMLIHGDLHHHNLLLGDGGWKLIDPHGRIAPAIMEVGPFLNNEWEQYQNVSGEQRLRQMERCLEFLSSELNIRIADLRVAASLHIILSTCWTLEDSDISSHDDAQQQALDMLHWLHWVE